MTDPTTNPAEDWELRVLQNLVSDLGAENVTLRAERVLTPEERRILRERIDAARRVSEDVREPGENERRCFGCRAIKPLDAFCKSKSHSRGRSFQCKACKVEYQRERRARMKAEGS